MKKRLIFLMMFLWIMIGTQMSVCALDESQQDLASCFGAQELYDSLSDETKALMSAFGVNGALSHNIQDFSFENLWASMKTLFTDNLHAPLRLLVRLIGVCFICGAFTTAVGSGSKISELLSTLFCLCLCTGCVEECVSALSTAAQLSGSFLLAYVPVMAVILTVGGNPASALSYHTTVLTAAQLLSLSAVRIFMPLCGIFMSLCVALSVNSSMKTQKLGAAFSRVITFFVGTSASLFAGLLSLRGLIANGKDSMITRSMRTAFSSFIPIVGSAISEAYSSILGALGLMKGSVAVLGVVAVFAINVPVLLQAGLYIISFQTAAFFSDSFSQDNLSGVFRFMGSTVKLMSVVCILEIFLIVISTGVLLMMKGAA